MRRSILGGGSKPFNWTGWELEFYKMKLREGHEMNKREFYLQSFKDNSRTKYVRSSTLCLCGCCVLILQFVIRFCRPCFRHSSYKSLIIILLRMMIM